MGQAVGQFTPIDAGESDVFGLDFTLDLAPGDTVISIVSVELIQSGGNGSDPNPSSRLDGSPTILSGIVSQRITNPVGCVVYKLIIFVNTAQGNVLDLWTYVTCVPIN